MADVLGELKGRVGKNEILKQARAVVCLEAKAKRQRAALAVTLIDLRMARQFLRDLTVDKLVDDAPPCIDDGEVPR